MTTHTRERRDQDGRAVAIYFVLAIAITWGLQAPYVLATLRHEMLSPALMPLLALSAFGPTLAAFAVVRGRRTELREIFGRWRTHPGWVVLALLLPMALHAIATSIEVMLGGWPAQWLYLPTTPERIAALVMFSLGEEFGWRGFAYPRLAARLHPVLASLIVGAVWGLWHFTMTFTPEHGAPDAQTFLVFALDFVAWSPVVAWVFERSGRSMAVALAVHAGAHLDNVAYAPEGEVRLRVLRFVVVVVAAVLCSIALAARHRRAPSGGATLRA